MLKFDGEGGWKIESLTDTDINRRLSSAEEKQKIEAQLGNVSKLKERLKELCTILGDSSTLLEENDYVDGSDSDH